MIEHPVACPVCGAAWDYATTWLGQLVAIHPVTRCIPKPAPVFEVEDQEPMLGKPRKCEECREMFTPHRFSGRAQIVCGPACRNKRNGRKKAASDAKRGNFWIARNAARSERRKHRKVA